MSKQRMSNFIKKKKKQNEIIIFQFLAAEPSKM